jgi:hypothetical protein
MEKVNYCCCLLVGHMGLDYDPSSHIASLGCKAVKVCAILNYRPLLFPLPTALKKLRLAAGRCRYQITVVQKTRIQFNYVLVVQKNKHHFYRDIVKKSGWIFGRYTVPPLDGDRINCIKCISRGSN